jgi:NAD binding domain of 6-phosphogluconate dehydrogenase
MARNLVAAGLNARVWDHLASATGPLADAGAVVATSARDAVRGAGVVITMLPTADVVESVIFGGGVADALADGCVWAQMGTIGVEATLRIRDRLAACRPASASDPGHSCAKGQAQQAVSRALDRLLLVDQPPQDVAPEQYRPRRARAT